MCSSILSMFSHFELLNVYATVSWHSNLHVCTEKQRKWIDQFTNLSFKPTILYCNGYFLFFVGLNVRDMLKHETLILTLAAVEKIEQKLLFHSSRNKRSSKFSMDTRYDQYWFLWSNKTKHITSVVLLFSSYWNYNCC